MRNENKETNQGKKAIGESMGSRIVIALWSGIGYRLPNIR